MTQEVDTMSKRTKIAMLIGAVAAVVSAVVLIIVYWDKLLEKFPCCGLCRGEDPDVFEEEEENVVIPYAEEELDDYADLEQTTAD